MDQERVAKFKRVVQESAGRFVILLTQVDPDALGADGAKVLLSALTEDQDVKIVYCGKISDEQNRAIVRELGLSDELEHIDGFELKDGDNIVLIDSSQVNDARVPSEHLPLDPLIVIDHHPSGLPEEDESHFFWVDESVNAASTLVVELAEALEVEFSSPTSTVLALGIYTDTDNLATATPRDRDAYGRMADASKQSDLKKLINFPLSPTRFEVFRHVLNNTEVHDGRLVAKAGWIKSEQGDNLARIADDLVRRSDISLVFVWGIESDTHTAIVKARSSDINVSDMHALMVDIFGEGVAGGKGGGESGKGGASIRLNLNRWAVDGSEPEQEALVAKCIHTWVFGSEVASEIKERHRRRRVKGAVADMLESAS